VVTIEVTGHIDVDNITLTQRPVCLCVCGRRSRSMQRST
jgi:hypothetical protein